jgi:hypothetical protein
LVKNSLTTNRLFGNNFSYFFLWDFEKIVKAMTRAKKVSNFKTNDVCTISVAIKKINTQIKINKKVPKKPKLKITLICIWMLK